MNQTQYIFVTVFFFNIGCLVSGTTIRPTYEQPWWKAEGKRFRIHAFTNKKSADVSINPNGLLVVPENSPSLGDSLTVCYFQVCSDHKSHICLVHPEPQGGKGGWKQLHNITIAKQGTGEYHDFMPWQIEEYKNENSDNLMKLQTIINKIVF